MTAIGPGLRTVGILAALGAGLGIGQFPIGGISATAGTSAPATASPAAAASLPLPVVDVTTLGARGDGRTDSSSAVLKAIATVQGAGGGTVFFPAGRFVFGQPTGNRSQCADHPVTARKPECTSLLVDGSVPITIAGAGSTSTVLVETNKHDNLMLVTADGTTIQDLTLDTQSNEAGTALCVVANHTTLQRARVLGSRSMFALFYAGPFDATPTRPDYNQGNQVLGLVLNDQVQDDGFSWSFQSGGLIQNVDHTGSRLALYIDQGATVDGYTYHPGAQHRATDGFRVTGPGSNITISGFTSYGAGGVVAEVSPRPVTGISILGERLMTAGNQLAIGNADGVTIAGCDLGASDILFLNPAQPSQHIVVRDCTALPAVRFAQSPSSTIVAEFDNDVFPAFAPVNSRQHAVTFADTKGGTTHFAVDGGTWQNRSGGFFSGTHTTFTVTNLAGYP